jgi:hypothetical protein
MLLPATSSAGQTAVPAAGKMTLTGNGGSFVTIDVPRDVVLDFSAREAAFYDYVVLGKWRTTGFAKVAIDGTGPFAGVVVAKDAPPPPPGEICAGVPDPDCPPHAVALQFGDKVLTHNRWVSFNNGFEAVPDTPHNTIALPAGRYRVYLIGDGATRVTMHLGGLDGTTSLTATQAAAHYENRYLAPRLDQGTGQRAVQAFGTAYTTARYNLTVLGLGVAGTAEMPTLAGTEWGLCAYFGAHPQPEETAYLPMCPNQYAMEENTLNISSADRVSKETMMAAAGAHGAGKDAIGFWYASYGAAQRSEAPFLNLDMSAP